MKNGNFPQRGDVVWVSLDQTIGSEINKTRPCLIISNNLANEYDFRVIIAPLTSKVIKKSKLYSFEILVEINKKQGKVIVDQIRSVDKIRLGKKIGTLTHEEMEQIDKALKLVLALA